MMFKAEDNIVLEYNTEREKLKMPEYGRNVLRMVEDVIAIEDREQRSRQAAGVVRVMELLNPQVHQEENWEQKLWDHLHILSDFKLDIDCPYPMPKVEELETRPVSIPLKNKPVKATHYGRNIESIIDLISEQEDGEQKTAMIRSLAIYMRQQYLIWNKDCVSDETIFGDIEKLSDYRIKVPEGISLSRISSDANFSRPGMNIELGGRTGGSNRRQGGQKRNFRGKNHQKGR